MSARSRLRTSFILAAVVSVFTTPATAQLVGGGGAAATDCWVAFDSTPHPNFPAARPTGVKCADGDPCDADARLGYCGFQVQLTLNSTSFGACVPTNLPTGGFFIPGTNNDLLPTWNQANANIQNDVDGSLPLNAATTDVPVGPIAITVPMKIGFATKTPVFQTTTFQLHPTLCQAALTPSNNFKCPASVGKDVDTFTFTCTPPIDSMTGQKISPCAGIASTFQQIQEHIFERKCSTQGNCHQGPNPPHGLCLTCALDTVYTDLVGVAPQNVAAATDGLKRVDPFNPANSLIVHKINGAKQLDSPTSGTGAYGLRMPYNSPPTFARPKLSVNEIKLITNWILAGAPQTGFVTTTAKGACQ